MDQLKHHKAIPLTIIGLCLVVTGLLGYIAYDAVWKDKTPTPMACTDEARICPDGSAVGRIGPNCEFATCPAVNTNNNVNSNVNAAPPPLTYEAPDGPFTVNNTNIFATAYRRSTDRLLMRLAKVNATTGQVVTGLELRLTDIQEVAGLPALPNPPSQVQFGRDGDSIVFLATSSSQSDPYVGIFRTSFSTPTKIETILLYDREHLLNNDLPSIASIRYNADTNRVAFVVAGESGQENNDVKIVSLADKVVRDLKSYPAVPQLVGFPQNGQLLQVLWTTSDKYTDEAKDRWSYDQINLETGRVSSTRLLIDESDPQVNRHVYLNPESISPNNAAIAFGMYDTSINSTVLVTSQISTGKVVKSKVTGYNGGGGFVWSPDSGKVVLPGNNLGIIYDLAKGAGNTIDKYTNGVVWYPGKYVVYMSSDGQLYVYDPVKKTSIEVPDISFTYYGEYGGPSATTVQWVNR